MIEQELNNDWQTKEIKYLNKQVTILFILIIVLMIILAVVIYIQGKTTDNILGLIDLVRQMRLK